MVGWVKGGNMQDMARLRRICVVAAFCVLPALVRAQFTTSTNAGTVTITGYTGSGQNVIIPATTNGLPITGIGVNAFANNAMTNVVIGANVTWIGIQAFQNCSNLKNLTVPVSVTNIELGAFCFCGRLSSVSIPTGVIGPNAFAYCGLLSLTLGSGVTEIDSGTFANCIVLPRIAIPASVTNIAFDAFVYCSVLTSITVNADNAYYSSTNGVLFDKPQATLLCCPSGVIGTYTIPGTVTAIGAEAFQQCSRLTSVTIPDNVTNIAYMAFAGCTALTNVTMGVGVSMIGDQAFEGCSALPNLTLGSSVTTIGAWTFADCSALVNVWFGDSVTTIGDNAFENCSALASMTILAGITNLGVSVFGMCSSLTAIAVDASNPDYSSANGVLCDKAQHTIIECPSGMSGAYAIPATVTTIGPNAFSYCSALTSITIPGSVTTIGADAFSYCSALTSITIPGSVTTIGADAFYWCNVLTSATIGNGVPVIGNEMFGSCQALTSVSIPSSVTSIGYNAFSYCSALTSVTIPGNVTSIGNAAFEDCTALSTIWIPKSVASVGTYAFYNCTNLRTVMVGSNLTYLSSETFQSCTNLVGIYFNGNQPTLQDSTVFAKDLLATVYYLAGTTGWGTTFGGCPTASFTPGPPVASPVTSTTLQNTPAAITLPVNSTTIPSCQLACSVVQSPVHGAVTMQYPTQAPTNSCYVWYTPTSGFIGTDTFTFVANDGAYNSNIATAQVAVLAETPPTVQGVGGLTTPGTAVTLTIPYTQPAIDAQLLTLAANIVTPPANGQAIGGIFVPGAIPTLTYTPNPGFAGVDSFTFVLNDGVQNSNVGLATVDVLQPGQHATNQIVLLVVNNLLLPEISNQVARLQNDLIVGGYGSTVVSWSNASGNALWTYLNTTHSNLPSTGKILEGAILIGNIPAHGCTDLDYWNLEQNIQTTAIGSVRNPGPYQIWVSRMWGVINSSVTQPFGSELTMVQRVLQANHDYRTGVSRLPQTAFAFDRAYGAEMSASQFQPPWPNVMELSTGPSDTADSYSHPLGCYEAFLRGGDLLAEESHGQGDLYTINMGGIWIVDEPDMNHRLVQVRSILNSSCEAGALGSVVNAQLCTRGGGNILSIGASETTFSGAAIPEEGQVPLLGTGISWGNALIQCPLSDSAFLIYYGDLSLPILDSPASNDMPVVTLTASRSGSSVTGFSVTNYMGTAVPVLNGIPPMTVNFSATASSPMNAIALSEWFAQSYDFGNATPDVSTSTPVPQTFTYYRAHRYLPRMEVADNYEARAYAEAEIRLSPQPGHPLRIICGLTGYGGTLYAIPSLDYLSPTTGKLWLQDQPYASGTWGATVFNYMGNGQTYSGQIAGTPDSELFQYSHYEQSQYMIPISNGTYQVNLGFADVWSVKSGTRILDIYFNGQKTNTVDPFALAGKPETAVTVSIPVTVTTNLLTISIGLNPASTVTNSSPPGYPTDGTFLNNIEIIPSGYANHPPVAGSVSATTAEGQATNVYVLSAASDPDGDEVILTGASTPANGSTVVSNTCVVYTPRAGFAGTDTFAYVVSDGNGGMATGTVTMTVTGLYGNCPTVFPQASPAIGPPPLAVSFTANATSPNSYPLTYAWNFGDGYGSTSQNPVHTYTNAGVYTATLTASDPYGDTGIGLVVVAASASPVITQQPVAQGAEGGQATFTVTATGSPTPSYQWLKNGAFISGATGSSYTVSGATYAQFGSLFSVIVSNCVGVTNSQAVTLYAGLVCFAASTYAPPAGYALDSGGFVNVALGYGWSVAQSYSRIRSGPSPLLDGLVEVSSNAANWICYMPNGMYQVTLSCGDASVASGPAQVLVQGVPAISNVLLAADQFTAVTNFPASVTNGSLMLTVGGSSGTTPINYVTIQRAPSLVTLSASATPTNGIMPLAVQFTASGTESDGNPVTYAWTFGDGGTSTSQNPFYIYTNAGVYAATVTANAYGTTATVSAASSIQIVVTSNLRTLTTATTGFGTGTVTLNPPGGIYLTGTLVTVTATAGSNSEFMGWSGAASGSNNPVTVVMTTNCSVSANFAYAGYGITATAGAGGSISPSGSVGVLEGDSQPFTITPATWYAISNVVVDSASMGALSTYTFSNISTSHVITAYFSALLAPLGTPLWWLAQYGYTNNEQALDPDGVAVWKDYLTGTNPTNPFAGPAYNIVPYAEGFENLTAWGGVYTNIAGAMGWSSGGFDQSKIVNLLYAYSATNLPLPSLTHTNVLALNTQWGTLTNSFGSGFDMSGSWLYLDMMMPSVPIAQTPASLTANDTGIKGGVYVNANNQLSVYHGVAASDGTLLSNTVDAASVIVPSGTWHRVTLVIDATATNPANALAMFQVLLDGAMVTNSNAYATGWNAIFSSSGVLPSTSPTGTWFRLATTNAVAKKLTALCFTGTGGVDDLTVTTVNPFATSSGACLLIVTTRGNGCSSLGSGPCISVPLGMGCGTQIVYSAAEWCRISALASNGVPLPSATGARFFTQMLANVYANVSNAVVFTLATPTQTGYTNVPTAWLTNWTEAAVQAMQGCDGFSLYTKYLLGLDPTSSNSYRLCIETLSASESNTVVVVRRNVSGSLAPNGMNGSLILQATHALTNGFTNLPATAITGSAVFDATGHRAYTNAVDGQTQFYKVIVQ